MARGGKDNTIVANRHAHPDGRPGSQIDRLRVEPGTATPDGATVAGLVVAARRDEAPVHVDVIGVGASPYDILNDMRLQVLGINVANGTDEKDCTGNFGFLNMRALLHWRLREALDPANDAGLALPPDPLLRAELCAIKWKLRNGKVQVESREEIIERIGRSVDRVSAVVLALIDTPKARALRGGVRDAGRKREHDPYAALSP